MSSVLLIIIVDSARAACETEGWSVLVYAAHATLGNWRKAWKGVMELSDSAYAGAGGNGHSKSNTLWWIATRPSPNNKMTLGL
jgi:hypothetical protein